MIVDGYTEFQLLGKDDKLKATLRSEDENEKCRKGSHINSLQAWKGI